MHTQEIHFLQSSAWQDFQESLGKQTFTDRGSGWQYLAILESGKMGKRLYCPYGPTSKNLQSLEDALVSLKAKAKQLSCDLVRIEPIGDYSTKDLKSLRLVNAKRNFQPAHTWCVDLAQTETELIANMNATTRNLHRNINKKGVTFSKTNDPKDIDKLLKFMHEINRRNSIKQHSDNYLKKQAEVLLPSGSADLFFAWFDKKCIAASLVYNSEATRYYAYAGTDFEYRKLQAGVPLVSHMIIDAKQAGLKAFDLYGVAPDDDPNHPWSGFTKFKKAFGGEQKDYLGTWELPLKPLKYKIYHRLQKAKN